MKFDFTGAGEIPQLDEFKLRLVRQMLRGCYFQDERKEEFDMLRYLNV